MKTRARLLALLRWILLSGLTGVLCGFASAVFLSSLEWITNLRISFPDLIFGLPLAGACIGYVYHRFGRSVEAGHNLILEELHEPQSTIPLRMTPMIFLTTLITHLFGGSAGREGTAVQMGGSLADAVAHRFRLTARDRKILLMAGMSGGFGSVFGVPLAGTIFGLEVLAVGELKLWAIGECATAAFVAHFVTLRCGIHHTAYPKIDVPILGLVAIFQVAFAAICFGVVARLFAVGSHIVTRKFKQWFRHRSVRGLVGGAALLLIYILIPVCRRYEGLGVPLILESFAYRVFPYDWFGKASLTILTLSAGLKGGEVTPLLFVGSTLGSALAKIPALALPILPALGLVSVFAAAANTPVACTLMAVELFGPSIAGYAALACAVSYMASGPHGIYPSQRHSTVQVGLQRVSYFLRSLFARPSRHK